MLAGVACNTAVIHRVARDGVYYVCKQAESTCNILQDTVLPTATYHILE